MKAPDRLMHLGTLPGAIAVLGLCAAIGCAGPKRVTLGGEAAAATRPPSGPRAPHLVRVGLAVDRDRAVLRPDGAAQLLEGSGRARRADVPAGGQVACAADGNAVRWEAGGRKGRDRAVILEPVDPGRTTTYDDRDYRGSVVVLVRGGLLTVVNLVELEAYLQGVVPWEIGRSGEDALAALEAQAVAARTYTVAHLGARENLGFDVWADVMDQVYRGARDEDALCNRAVRSTAGQVLRYDGVEIEAYYSSTCGGVCSDIAEVWPREPRPYLRSHPDAIPPGAEPFCAGGKYASWTETWTGERLEQILAATLPEYLDYVGEGSRAAWAGTVFQPRSPGADPRRPGRLRDLEIAGRTMSGRVARLDVSTDAGIYSVRGDRVRWVLPPAGGQPAILRSALFDLEVEQGTDGRPRSVTARGRGFGHGIGLCQVGALAMARAGYSCRRILEHYYPGARLERLDDR